MKHPELVTSQSQGTLRQWLMLTFTSPLLSLVNLTCICRELGKMEQKPTQAKKEHGDSKQEAGAKF